MLHLSAQVRAHLYEARRLLDQSLSVDPGYARAYAMLSRTHVRAYIEPLDADYLEPAAIGQAHELAEKAVQLDPNLPFARSQLGWVLTFLRRHDEAIGEFERAVLLNPNFTDYQFGLGLVFAGQASRAVEVLKSNMRLDPFQAPNRLAYLGHAYYMLGRYADAVLPLRECASRVPNFRIVHVWLAATYAQQGRFDDARAEVAETLRIEPGFTIARWKCTAVYKTPHDAEHLFDGLRKAGLPEY
jgi:adenylate cyclase